MKRIETYRDIAETIKEVRTKKKMTYRDVARLGIVERCTVENAERSDNMHTYSVIDILKSLGLQLAIVKRKDKPNE